jgi:hypothetical protein
MHGRMMKRVTMPPYKYARTMRREDFGTVRRAADYKKWLAYAKKHQLDPNTNVRTERRRMERLWLRPLSQVPKQ